MPKEQAPYVTKADIEAFLDREERRKEAARLAEELERENKPLKEKLAKFVELKAGASKSIERSGFVLAFKTRAGRVKWKDEFILAEGVEAAQKLERECPKSEYLSVEKKAA
jgi:hypothetical protein